MTRQDIYRQLSSFPAKLGWATLAYLLSAWLGGLTAGPHGLGHHLELQIGVALAWVVLFGPRYLWVLIPCQILHHLTTYGPGAETLVRAQAEIVAVVLCTVLLKSFGFSPMFGGHRDVLRFFFCTLTGMVLAASSASVTGALLLGSAGGPGIGLADRLSDLYLGAVVAAPLVWNIWLRPIDSGRTKHIVQGYVALLIFWGLTLRVYATDFSVSKHETHLLLFSMICGAWILYRLGIRGAVLINLLYVLIAERGSLSGLGPLAYAYPSAVQTAVSVYASAVSFISLIVACMVRERIWVVEEAGHGERYFKRLIESATDNVAVLEANGVIRYENRAVEQVGAWTPEEMVGQNAFTYIHADDISGAWQAFQEALRNPGEKYRSIFRWRAKSGQWIYLETTGQSLLHDPDVRGIIVSSRDVTDRQRTIDALNQLLSAIEQTTESVVITDRDGTIQYVNAGFEKSSGYSRDEVIGKNPRILKSGNHPPEFYGHLWQEILQGRSVRTVFINKRKDGRIYYDSKQISPMRDATGRISGFIAVGQDITDQRLMEEQYRQAQKMEAVGRLAGGVAHDFNNLLTVINGYAKLTQAKLQPGDALRANIDEILMAGERAADLTKQLLTFSRKQVAQPQPFSVNELIAQSEKMYRFMAGIRVTIKLELASDLPPILADPTMLDQVLTNLIVNARDAMPDGGTLTIRTASLDPVRDADDLNRDAPLPPHGQILIEVRDTGIGMTDEIKAKMFEPFFTTKPKDKGTGLGLPTVYAIIQQAGGYIGVESSPGQGTSFRIILPVTDQRPRSIKALEESKIKDGGGALVLLVDDEPGVRGLAERILRQIGYEVLTADSGEQALEIAWRHTGKPIRLLLTDMIMPGMTGRELADKFKVISPQSKTLIISGYTEKIDFLKEGEAFLQKPFTPQALLTAVQNQI